MEYVHKKTGFFFCLACLWQFQPQLRPESSAAAEPKINNENISQIRLTWTIDEDTLLFLSTHFV